MRKEKLFVRKYNKERYTFFEIQGDYGISYMIETPENCFGYPDYIFIEPVKGTTYTLWRYCPKWIQNKCLQAVRKYIEKTIVK